MLKACRALFLTQTHGLNKQSPHHLHPSLLPDLAALAGHSEHVSRMSASVNMESVFTHNRPKRLQSADSARSSWSAHFILQAVRTTPRPSSSSTGSAVSEEWQSSGDFGRRCVGLMRSARIINEPADLPCLWLRVCTVSVLHEQLISLESWLHQPFHQILQHEIILKAVVLFSLHRSRQTAHMQEHVTTPEDSWATIISQSHVVGFFCVLCGSISPTCVQLCCLSTQADMVTSAAHTHTLSCRLKSATRL